VSDGLTVTVAVCVSYGLTATVAVCVSYGLTATISVCVSYGLTATVSNCVRYVLTVTVAVCVGCSLIETKVSCQICQSICGMWISRDNWKWHWAVAAQICRNWSLLSYCVAWFELNWFVGKCSAGENGNMKDISHCCRFYPFK
jgi:hypothetical protein